MENGSVNRKYRIFAVLSVCQNAWTALTPHMEEEQKKCKRTMICTAYMFNLKHISVCCDHIPNTTSKNPLDTVSVSRVLHHPDRCKKP